MQHPTCLFCLEPVKTESAPNPIGCQCRIITHKDCFKQWFDLKQHLECPICHTISVPNRVAYDNIHIVYIDTTQYERAEQASIWSKHQKAAAVCCCLLFGWSVGFTILELIAAH
jgi:hypothetical protein